MDDQDLTFILARWGAWQLAANLSSRTIGERANVIRHLLFIAQCGPLEISAENILSYLTRPGVSPSSRATYHASIRAYHAWLLRTGRRHDDPTVMTPAPKRPKGVPRPIADQKLAAVLLQVNRRRTRMMILLAAYCGLRVHEIAKVHGADVDLDGAVLYVTGKGNKTAAIPLHERVIALALDFPADDWWFPSYKLAGEPITPAAVSTAIHRVMQRAGVKGKPHQLRHWYGTSLVRNGADLRTVQELMRHESLATTQIYTMVSDESRRHAIATLNLPAITLTKVALAS